MFLKQYNIKNPSTYSRAKLPLFYEQVKDKVDAMIKRDVKGTYGFAFTSDLWSSLLAWHSKCAVDSNIF